MDQQSFRDAVGHFASGVTVVTIRDPQGIDLGMTVSAFCSLSLEPPLVVVCVGHGRYFYPAMAVASGFCVNVLGEDQAAISDQFAGGTRDSDGHWQPWPEDRDRFEDVATLRSEQSGALMLAEALVGLDCRLHDRHDAGDHSIFIGQVEGFRLAADLASRGPLIFHTGRYGSLKI